VIGVGTARRTTVPMVLDARTAEPANDFDGREVAAADLDVPKNFQVGLDLTTAGHARGPWDRPAVQTFLATQPYGRLCVDFPADPPNQFPLNLVISLGIVDITEPKLENVGVLVDRVEEVTSVIG
jgi:5-methyltetrahydropteroyltriglutamate--homocysteine methyltransferase